MLRQKFKIVVTLVLTENSVDFSRYRFWRPNIMHITISTKAQDEVVVHFVTF